jgi:hypothetical protein
MRKQWTIFAAALSLAGPTSWAALISDGGFENPSFAPGSYDYVWGVYDVLGTAWNFAGWSGITGLPSEPWGMAVSAPEGNQVAMIQNYFDYGLEGHLSQIFYTPSAGVYRLTFLDAGRPSNRPPEVPPGTPCLCSEGNVLYEVRIDGVAVGTFSTVSGQPFTEHSLSFYLAQGDRTLSFDVTAPDSTADNTAFIDHVTLDPLELEVAIDIKPGSLPNAINLGSNGTVPVAILSSATFDATTVDPTTVTLASATVKLKGQGTPMSSFEEVNNDGRQDLVVHVLTSALQLSTTDSQAVLRGQTYSGIWIQGSDSVRIVR